MSAQLTELSGDIGEQAPASARRHAPVRLAVFTSHPIQYQAPLFRALAASAHIIPTVYFGSRHGLDAARDADFGATFKWDVPLLDGYEHAFLENVAARPNVSRFSGVRVRGLREVWSRGAYDAVLVLGWQTLAHVQAWQAAWGARIPLIVRGESTLDRPPGAGARPPLRRRAWLAVRSHLYGAAFERVGAYLVIGSRNRDYYRAFGVPEEKLFWAPYCVDNEWFALAPAVHARERAAQRARLGVSDRAIVFASSAKLIERKRPADLLDAVAVLRRRGIDAHALFIGDGVERAALESRAAERGVGDAAHITGFVNQSALPGWYAAADALVLPSDARETWGLVVNEAMAAGLPVIVSDAAGCAPDLVREGENGFVYPCGDVNVLGERLSGIAAMSAAEREALGAASRRIITGFTVEQVTRATEDALRFVLRRGTGASARRGAGAAREGER